MKWTDLLPTVQHRHIFLSRAFINDPTSWLEKLIGREENYRLIILGDVAETSPTAAWERLTRFHRPAFISQGTKGDIGGGRDNSLRGRLDYCGGMMFK